MSPPPSHSLWIPGTAVNFSVKRPCSAVRPRLPWCHFSRFAATSLGICHVWSSSAGKRRHRRVAGLEMGVGVWQEAERSVIGRCPPHVLPSPPSPFLAGTPASGRWWFLPPLALFSWPIRPSTFALPACTLPPKTQPARSR